MGRKHIRDLKIIRQEGGILPFVQDTYNTASGEAVYASKSLPYILDSQPLFWLNIFFGLALLFFGMSAFWMFKPATSVFKNGLYFTLAGIALMLVLLFV